MSTLFISSGGSAESSSGVWRASSSDYQYNYNAFTPGEDINLDQVSISTNTYDAGQGNPGNFQVGVYAAGINASTPGSLISYLSGPVSPTAGSYNSYTPTSSINLQAGTQYWLGFTLSSDTGSNLLRVKVSTSSGSSTYSASGWNVGTRYVIRGTGGGTLTDNSARPATFELYGTGKAVCFYLGTKILTKSGEISIERINIGDLVVTTKGLLPVKWVAKRTISNLMVPVEFFESSLPVLIESNSLGCGVPSRDLLVSENHGISADGKVVNAYFLINGINIRKTRTSDFRGDIRYFHLEFEDEVFVYANNTMACSYVNAGNRRGFDNYPQFVSLYGNADLTVRSRMRTPPRNKPTMKGYKDRVMRAWRPLSV